MSFTTAIDVSPDHPRPRASASTPPSSATTKHDGTTSGLTDSTPDRFLASLLANLPKDTITAILQAYKAALSFRNLVDAMLLLQGNRAEKSISDFINDFHEDCPPIPTIKAHVEYEIFGVSARMKSNPQHIYNQDTIDGITKVAKAASYGPNSICTGKAWREAFVDVSSSVNPLLPSGVGRFPTLHNWFKDPRTVESGLCMILLDGQPYFIKISVDDATVPKCLPDGSRLFDICLAVATAMSYTDGIKPSADDVTNKMGSLYSIPKKYLQIMAEAMKSPMSLLASSSDNGSVGNGLHNGRDYTMAESITNNDGENAGSSFGGSSIGGSQNFTAAAIHCTNFYSPGARAPENEVKDSNPVTALAQPPILPPAQPPTQAHEPLVATPIQLPDVAPDSRAPPQDKFLDKTEIEKRKKLRLFEQRFGSLAQKIKAFEVHGPFRMRTALKPNGEYSFVTDEEGFILHEVQVVVGMDKSNNIVGYLGVFPLGNVDTWHVFQHGLYDILDPSMCKVKRACTNGGVKYLSVAAENKMEPGTVHFLILTNKHIQDEVDLICEEISQALELVEDLEDENPGDSDDMAVPSPELIRMANGNDEVGVDLGGQRHLF